MNNQFSNLGNIDEFIKIMNENNYENDKLYYI